MQSMAYLASTREALQKLLSLTESVQSLAVAQAGESEEEGEARGIDRYGKLLMGR